MRVTVATLTPLLVIGIVTAPATAAHASGEDCSTKYGAFGPCASGLIGDGGVSISAHDQQPESSGGGQPNRGEQKPRPEAQGFVVPPPVPRGRMAADVDVPCTPSARLSGGGQCSDGQHAFLPPARGPSKPADPVPVVAAVPAVSLADVAQFVPRDASIRSQPNGWAIVGAPVNLFTDATPQVVDGVLLGRPAQVRFVPVSFAWDHGDGTSTTVVGPGASWRELGQQDFTPTDTSHVYESVGDRQVSLTISYSPAYRFDGGGWQQIAGTLPVQVGPVTIRVLQGSTVLVGGACGERNAGPGCP
ncbi:hypothetical protein [Clavibacter michiganensis]|uniref:hypothetical protein n=1 Tax=Clavibacter michiganensis TaxID=28447 RepID=UPI0009A5B879|nr:hypothetical protein [Clavibacter michiganensis]MBF4638889.1 hypothetical protein [Clavibacter michiganensis subsp. michiganensis]MDO4125486.1 hypothetical protein [Clavibacter michiganensis]MDO4140186.1 hypothetical protein [Clavibacter michiganensis]OQJ66210.1 hypothetical protein B5P23_09725 [Clavibacter michiganensis subsp. michiganensis]QGV75649.1 hypothetical protein EFE39_10600 [Clavibacter michiganensis subsp. michiganensis]